MHFNLNPKLRCSTGHYGAKAEFRNVTLQSQQFNDSEFSRPRASNAPTYTANVSTQRRKFDAISELYLWAINELDGHIYEYRCPTAFVTTILPLTPIEVEYSVLGASVTLDAKRFANEFILRREIVAKGLTRTLEDNKHKSVSRLSVELRRNVNVPLILAIAATVSLYIQHPDWDYPLYWISCFTLFNLHRPFTIDDLRERSWLCFKLLDTPDWLSAIPITTVGSSTRFMKIASEKLSGIYKDEFCLQAMIIPSCLLLFTLLGNPLFIRFPLVTLSLYAAMILGRTIVRENLELRHQLRSSNVKIGQLETEKMMMMMMMIQMRTKKHRDSRDDYFVDSANEMED